MALKRPRLEEGRRRSLSAATVMVPLDQASSWKTWKFGNRDWQIEGWRLYDIVPEHRFLANWIGDSIAQARLFVTEVSETGEETGEVTDRRIARLAAVPLGTGSQRDDNLRLAGVDLAVGGECWIVGEGAVESPEDAEGSWFVVTGSAFKREGGDVLVRRPKTRGGDHLRLRDGTDILIRCWRPHPNDVDQADSPTRAAIVPLREIELLTKREFAELDSRLTGAGMWFLPEGIDFPRDPENDPEGLSGFMAYMQRAAAASMREQGQASSVVPMMATVPDHWIENLDKLKGGLVQFWSELSSEITPMKDKAIGRVASAFEIPNEVLTGLSVANHWGAWAISEEGIKRIKSYLGYIADALTRGFLRPALEKMGITDPERYAFSFDTSPLAARPNRMDEALQLWDRLLLSDEEAVKAGAFDKAQMPSAEQRIRMLLLRMVESNPQLLADPAIQRSLGLPAIGTTSTSSAPAITSGEEDDPADGPPDTLDDDPDDDTPGPGTASLAARLEARTARALTSALDDRITGLALAPRAVPPPTPQHVFNAASKLMVFRALELAGGRLTTPAERRSRWGETPRHELHVRVGPVNPDKAEKVLAGAWEHVPQVAGDLGVDPADLGRLLHGYVLELLTRGMAHHDDLLYAALSIANRGQGLVSAGV